MNQIPLINPEVASKLIDNEVIIVNPQKAKVLITNEVGAAIWELIDGKRNISTILNTIIENFYIDRKTAKIDLLNFLGDLLSKGVILFHNE